MENKVGESYSRYSLLIGVFGLEKADSSADTAGEGVGEFYDQDQSGNQNQRAHDEQHRDQIELVEGVDFQIEQVDGEAGGDNGHGDEGEISHQNSGSMFCAIWISARVTPATVWVQ